MDPASSPDSSTNEDPFLTISEDLIPSAPLPTSSITTLSFSGLLDPPLRLQTNVSECGGQLWPAGMVLSEYLIRNHLDEMRGKTILELGTGSGLVGLALALALTQTQVSTPPTPRPAPPSTKIHLTDGTAALVPLLHTNIALNNLTTPFLTETIPHLLPWGAPHPPLLTQPHPDILLAADCVYFEPAFPLLEATINEAMGETTVLWFCYLRRRRRDAEMVRRLERNRELVVREVGLGELGERYGRASGYGGGAGEGRGKGGGVVLFEVRRAEGGANGGFVDGAEVV